MNQTSKRISCHFWMNHVKHLIPHSIINSLSSTYRRYGVVSLYILNNVLTAIQSTYMETVYVARHHNCGKKKWLNVTENKMTRSQHVGWSRFAISEIDEKLSDEDFEKFLAYTMKITLTLSVLVFCSHIWATGYSTPSNPLNGKHLRVIWVLIFCLF